jgi:putative ABC transport system permease protein
LRFMQNKDLGFNMDQILVIKSPKIAKNLKLNLYDSTYHVRVDFLKKELLREVNIHYFSRSSDIPGRTFQKASTFKKMEQNMEDGRMAYSIYVDEDYLPAYEMELVAGRNFSKEMVSDKEAVIVNEMVVELLGFKSPQDAIGQMATMSRGVLTNVRIIGVTKNINNRSLAHKQSPMVFAYVVDIKAEGSWGDANYYSLKIKTEDLNQTIIKAENSFREVFPNDPFEYFFLDDHFNEQYKADQQFGKIFGIFTSLAILVACLGLFGLVAYVSSTRTKEIGIRKVMGASTTQILTLLSKQFVKLLIIAAILAVPISWWGGDTWLSNYAYHIEIDGWLFAIATLIVFSIALFTVLWQSISTANANPVDSLRDE